MRSALVVADPVSPPDRCTDCGQALEGYVARHVCPACGSPQPMRASENYFDALGLLRRFSQDRSEIEKRFYEISRLLHPDRYSLFRVEKKQASLDRMSFLNRAYQTLRNSELLREYLLALEDVSPPSKVDAPADLVEVWFEIQDLAIENPGAGSVKIAEFLGRISDLKKMGESNLEKMEREADASLEKRGLLEKIARESQALSYLASLERDVERMQARFNKG